MTTLAQLKALVRAELGDGNPTAPLWPEERLAVWTRDAMREYGRVLPRRATTDLLSVVAQSRYTLPVDLLSVAGVEWPVGTPLSPAPALYGLPNRPVFQVDGPDLVLSPAPSVGGQAIRVRYSALYAEPLANDDTLATPPSDDELLVLAVATRALRWLATAEAAVQPSLVPAPRGASGSGGGGALDSAAERYERARQARLARRERTLRTARLTALGP